MEPSRLRRRLFLTVCWVAMVVGMALPLRSQVLIQGKVEYADPPDGYVFKPARDIMVEIEGDWWWAMDPEKQTNDDGTYGCNIANPPWWWGDYDDVDVEAYAKKPDWCKVKPDTLCPWAYNCTSQEVNNVNDNQTVSLNLKIRSFGEFGVTSDWTTAVRPMAYEIAWRMIEHRRYLERQGLRGFDTASVVFMGFSPTHISWYNHFFGQIHLVSDVPGCVKHEYGHQIHDQCSLVLAPMGLNDPRYHSHLTETDRFCAYTEGWAEFLKDYTEQRSETYEPTNPNWINSGWSDHAHCEGEVSGLLWDLSDPVGPEEVRNRNNAIPTAIPQTWQDRIADTNLQRVWQIMSVGHRGMNPLNPWTIREFLHEWRVCWPDQDHALKAIAYNRRISPDGLPESAPGLDIPQVTRTGNRFTVTGTVTERDSEDRPFVKLELWYRTDALDPVLLQSQVLDTGWTGATHAYTLSGSVNQVLPYTSDVDQRARQRIAWIVVNDDMLYVAARAEVPAYVPGPPINQADLAVTNAWRGLLEPHPPVAPDPHEDLYRETEPRFRTIRNNLLATETLIENRAKISERVLRQARGFYKTATIIGTLKMPADGKVPMLKHVKATQDLRGVEPWEEPKELLGWEMAVIKGGGVPKPLKEEDKGIFKEAFDLSIQQRQQLAAMAKDAEAIPVQLLDAVQAYPWDQFEFQGPTRECVERDAAAVQDALRRVAADQETPRRLDFQIQVLEALMKGPSEQPQQQPEAAQPGEQLPGTVGRPAKQPDAAQPESKQSEWSLEATGFKYTDNYVEQYCKDQKELWPSDKGQELLLVYCRLTNQSKEPQTPCLTERLCGQTALYDTEGAAYTPLDYDASQESNKTQGYAALPVGPGEGADFVIVFSVPRGIKPSRLVFTILRHPDDVGLPGKDVKIKF